MDKLVDLIADIKIENNDDGFTTEFVFKEDQTEKETEFIKNFLLDLLE